MAEKRAFPKSEDEFSQDERVYYDKASGKWMLEETHQEYEWDAELQRWVEPFDEAQHERFQAQYAGATEDSKKRKSEPEQDSSRGPKKAKQEKKNSAVYVTSLPQDVTVEEIAQVFSRYGVIAEEIDERKPRIKLYTNDDGSLKGDALIVYFRPESVHLAIDMLDDTDFRIGQTGPEGKMRVKEADMSYKKQDNKPKAKSENEPAQEGPRKKKAGLSRDQSKIIHKTEMMNKKLADWDDDPQQDEAPNPLTSKTVILTQMFTLKELADDPVAELEIKEDVFKEASKCGEVTKCVLWDKEDDGIVTVRFKEPAAAMSCIKLMHGRRFDGRTVQAFLSDGRDRFQKTRRSEMQDDDEEERLERMAKET